MQIERINTIYKCNSQIKALADVLSGANPSTRIDSVQEIAQMIDGLQSDLMSEIECIIDDIREGELQWK